MKIIIVGYAVFYYAENRDYANLGFSAGTGKYERIFLPPATHEAAPPFGKRTI